MKRAIPLLVLVVAAALAAVACAPLGEEASPGERGVVAAEMESVPAQDVDRPIGGYGIPAPAEPIQPRPPFAPIPTPAPPPGIVAGADVVEAPAAKVVEGAPAPETPLPELAALVAQQRVIVRTAQATLVVADVARAVDDVADMAREMGGWVVSSDVSGPQRGQISVRVPAQRLDEALDRLSQMALKVKSVVTNSQDVTDEYVDLKARLENARATEAALLRILEQATEVEDALAVQRELSRVQEEIETLKGRIKFLEETSAFSLLTVFLELEPQDMPVDAGPDLTAGVGEGIRFRATFRPPEGVEQFLFTWDFGDGSRLVTGTRVAPTPEEGLMTTATVSHSYSSEEDSPYIAKVTVEAFGDAGAFKGEDSIMVTVFRQPVVEVFAGEDVTVEEGREVRLEGSFTRPPEVREITYRWDFGDGTPPLEGSVALGETTVEAVHVYQNARPRPYVARLTIRGEGPAGQVEAQDTLAVFVTEAPGWVVGGWAVGDTARDALRYLTAVLQLAVVLAIWAAIFSPLWGGVLLLTLYLRRRRLARAHALGGAEASNAGPSPASGQEEERP